MKIFDGLLLAPHVDALFDGGWITFADDGGVVVSPLLPAAARAQLGVQPDWRVAVLRPAHLRYLAFHRELRWRRQ